MDYNAAVDGDIEKFRKCGKIILDQVLTPRENTILHIHITARTKPKSNILTKMGLRKKPKEVIIGTNFVKDVLEMCPVLLWKANSKSETPLHMAARHGHADIVEVLITECKESHQNNHPEEGVAATRRMLGMTNEAKDTALHEAVRYDHFDVVKILSGADPELPYDANSAGETPLYLAAERGYKDVVEHLLTCKSQADHGPMGRNALHAAVMCGNNEVIKTLLQRKERCLTSKADEQGRLPLHLAIIYAECSTVKELLDADKSAGYKSDNEGKTALHVAAARGEVNIMKKLIDSCPGCWELVDNEGRNVFHFALDSKSKRAVQLLLDNPLLGNLINEKDNQGNTPLLHLAASGSYMKSFVSHPKVDKLVFDHQNCNVSDIVGTYYISLEQIRLVFRFLGLGGKRRHAVLGGDEKKEEGNAVNYKNKDKKDKRKSQYEKLEKHIKETQESHLVVAALIATVSFAAGITLPGGYINEKGPDQGTSVLVLTRNKAFQAFVILNTIAMVFSSYAIFINLCVSTMKHKPAGYNLWRRSTQFICLAMVAMVLAFVMGMYAVLYRARELAISACAIGGLFLFVFENDLAVISRYCSLIFHLIKARLTTKHSDRAS